ncbi:MAG: energy transducer TonB [Holophagales bacterium]|nr:energy transducer TonB [Holophagales bacterium]MYF96831.1 energy transducer TonB [Holophagales bacterium]
MSDQNLEQAASRVEEPAKEEATPPTSAEQGLLTYVRETREDNRTFRYSLGLAVILHGILLIVKLPDLYGDTVAPPPKPKVFVVQQVRFKPPPPKEEQQIPKPKSKKVPIPDPTPDEPEPIRIDEPEEIDIPEVDDLDLDLPEAPPPPEPKGPIHLTGDVTKPERISAPQPQYTEIARRARIQGAVILQATIDKNGDVTDAKVLKPLPMGLAEAAVSAVEQWKFKPATLNGKPVAVYYNLTVTFELQ